MQCYYWRGWGHGLEEFEQGLTSSHKNGARPKSNLKELEPTKILTKMKVEIKVREILAKINFERKVSMILESLVKELKLLILDLDTLVNNINSVGIQVLYLGYTEMRVRIPEIGQYGQNILMMVQADIQDGKIDYIEFGI